MGTPGQERAGVHSSGQAARALEAILLTVMIKTKKKQRERKSVLVHEIYPTKLLLIFFVVCPERGMSGNGC